MSEQFAYKRFWCPTGIPIDLSDGGFLPEPEGEYTKFLNPKILPFESVAQTPCLVLLGEPGSGKSHSIKDACDRRVGVAEGEGALFLNLGAYSSDTRLIAGLFKGPDMLAWLNGEQRLHLFLDSLDECKLLVKPVGTILAEEIQKLPIERLRLRIACRPADWPSVLDAALRSLWSGDDFQSYDLAPLRRVDVEAAAVSLGISAEDFLSEVRHRDVVPLAIRPLTLNFLLSTYKRTGSLPRTKAALYEQGCRHLCEELSPTRRDMGEAGQFSADERLAVASRIGAATMFGNRVAVWNGPDVTMAPENDMPVADLTGGTEKANQQDFQVTQALVNETLGTGLFSGRGPHRFGWVHQTFGEYLAARFIRNHDLPVRQAVGLLTHPGDGKVIPQLREVAAWAAGLMPEVFRELMLRDPEVLLSSDIENTRAEDRATLVQTLLELFDREKLADTLDSWGSYRKFAHPGLADQLRPFILDQTKGFIARRAAIKIAEKCGVASLRDELVTLALNPAEPAWARVKGLYALKKIADHSTRESLRPLLFLDASEDPEDEIKGCALDLLWPGQITIDDVFAVLSPPKSSHLIGAYCGFLERFKDELRPEHLPAALEWLGRRSKTGERDNLGGLQDAVVLLAWESVRLPGVAEKFATSLARRMNRDQDVLNYRQNSELRKLIAGHADRRRLLLGFLTPLLVTDAGYFHIISTGFAVPDDLDWVLDQVSRSSTPREKDSWVRLSRHLFSSRDTRHLDWVYSSSRVEPLVASQFEWLLKPVLLDSAEAEQMRKRHEEYEELEAEPEYQVTPPPSERVKNELARFEAGDTDAFWKLNLEMTLKPDSRFYGDGIESDLTGLPGWLEADETTQRRIVAAAKQYILYGEPENEKWFGTNQINHSALAGYRAMRLVLKHEPEWLDTCSCSVWKTWAAIILTYPHRGEEAEGARKELIGYAYKQAAEEIMHVLLRVVDHECSQFSIAFVVRLVEHCWDQRLENAILEKAKDPNLQLGCVGFLVDKLLAHRSEGAKQYALSLLALPLPAAGDCRTRSVLVAAALAAYSDSATWATIWKAVESDTEFGRELAPKLWEFSDDGARRISPGLDEVQLADLFIWLEREHPRSQDPRVEGGFWVTPRHSIADLRDGVLYRLKTFGTPESCVQLQRIAAENPHLVGMKWVIQDAEAITREKTWVPLTPREVVALAKDRSARLVRDGGELLEVVLESLQRIEKKIHGETPEVHLLWNKLPDGAYRPKDENELSDYIKNRFDEDLCGKGIVVNREVEIHRPAQGKPGERTDIHIDAVSLKRDGLGHDRITVILETKGCWHRELKTAMRTQLVDRYLAENHSRFGLYLVGWFNCDRWDKVDDRRSHAEKAACDLRGARDYFQQQAAELSSEDLLIKSFVLDVGLR